MTKTKFVKSQSLKVYLKKYKQILSNFKSYAEENFKYHFIVNFYDP